MMKNCVSEEALALFTETNCEHPLDSDIVNEINKLCGTTDNNGLIRRESDDYEIFKHRKDIVDPLWRMLIEKAIKCLRYYDNREPFQESDGKKTPKAYGIDTLKKYYDEYTEFERILYGSNRYYRDHVIHVFRTWISGIELLVKNDGKYLANIAIQEKHFTIDLTNAEKLSIWTLVALTHDLGYPLEKAKSIIDTTSSMLSTFITNPDISMDFSFHGVQNYMNDFIVRLMSSKMKPAGDNEEGKPQYVARLQPKYYFKFQKSLERNHHGILSTLIIYKLLTYFLESDYNINEDYHFNEEECRQFYIRREILRAISSHTCNDVYQLYMTSFSFLLRICDDTQEWGRKNISELYVKSNQEYKLEDIDLIIDPNKKEHKCVIREEIAVPDEKEMVANLINRLREQSLTYVTIFRDGQDTVLRDFSFERKLTIKFNDIVFILTLIIAKDAASILKGEITYISDGKVNKLFGKEFFAGLPTLDGDDGLKVFDVDGNDSLSKKADSWHKGTFSISLSQ